MANPRQVDILHQQGGKELGGDNLLPHAITNASGSGFRPKQELGRQEDYYQRKRPKALAAEWVAEGI